MFAFFLWSAVIGLVLHALYKRCTGRHDYFAKVGIKHPKPLPIFGNSASLLFTKTNLSKWLFAIYRQFPTER